ncbi:MAG: PhoX family protein [Burkholderiales bacterium]
MTKRDDTCVKTGESSSTGSDSRARLLDPTQFEQIIQHRLENSGRRGLFKGAAAAAVLGYVGNSAALAQAPKSGEAYARTARRPTALRFTPVAKNLEDKVTVPDGYTATVLYRLGDPIAAMVPPYRNDGADQPASFAYRAGDHHDAVEFFGLGANGKYSPTASNRGLLVMNHEAITPSFLHAKGVSSTGAGATQARSAPDEVLREFYVHGVSVVEVQRAPDGGWSYKQNSPFNRRVHTLTEAVLTGPAAGSLQMVTKYSPDGLRTRGTVNNCAAGYTPWNTYVTCEENFAGYFRRNAASDNARRSPKDVVSLARYGVAGTGRELWATITPDSPDNLFGRWNAEATGDTPFDDYRNAPNTYGWVVEIDPFDAHSLPRKRTALGRFAHEGAQLARVQRGKPLVWYSGDDSRNEYIYKYVSTAVWDPADATRGLAAGDKYLDNGRLYVAKFNADSSGEWLELKHGSPGIAGSKYVFADQADVLINTRLAADALGATRMDRPEWGAVDPISGAVYMTLTNNNAALRPIEATDAANPRHYNDARTDGTAQRGNPNGHIVRWLEAGNEPAAMKFRWDIFLFGARAGTDPASVNLSGLSADNDFSSPDGLWFSRASGICWIQTDDGAYTDVTNCMMLAALPGRVGDGEARHTVTNTDAKGAVKQVQTYVGAKLGDDRLRRFLVGPKQCEITGITETPDGKTLFVNIQHPGEDVKVADIGNPSAFPSHWPDGGLSRPRSATIAITRNDGGVVGA